VLAELGKHSLFGEMSFFSPAPHSANVVAKTPLTLLSIARVDYDDLIRDGAVAAYKLAYNIVDSVAARLRRMDDWVEELSTSNNEDDDRRPEWRRFREKLFDGWNL
jgi:CRP-like cAMP-binding protein